MKNLLSLILVAAIFVSCSSDDDDGGVALQGTWKLTAFNTQNAYDLNGDGIISNDVMGQTNCLQNETLVFNETNTGAEMSTSRINIELEIVTGTTDEYEYSFECLNVAETTAFTWTQNGNTVVITQGIITFSGTQTGNEITFFIPNGYAIPVEDGDEIVFVNEDLTMVYQKQ
jgi:hypothetical protein